VHRNDGIWEINVKSITPPQENTIIYDILIAQTQGLKNTNPNETNNPIKTEIET
jgi:hypothetical protein